MTAAELVGAIMFVAVIAYAVFGGADFGSGVWDLTAGGTRRGARTRRLVDHAIGPVWEANHVWLIFVLVLLWTGFPGPYAELMRSLAIPFWLAGLGIVARGAGFAFRKYAPSLRFARAAGIVFAVSSLATPIFLGAIAGAIASGRVPHESGTAALSVWTGPTSILGALLAVSTCTFLAGVLLAAEADTLGDDELADELRRKSLVGGIATGAIAIAGIPVLIADAETLVDGLLGRGLPFVVASAVAGLTTLALLARSELRWARVSAAIAVAAVVAGWGAGQYPWILVDHVTLDEGAGATAALIGTAIASGVALIIVVPALAWLYRLADTNQVGTVPQPPVHAERD
ncbi:MAG: cytochrome d ubiquinol oxidase subunit II [Actinomycetota bacterium]